MISLPHTERSKRFELICKQVRLRLVIEQRLWENFLGHASFYATKGFSFFLFKRTNNYALLFFVLVLFARLCSDVIHRFIRARTVIVVFEKKFQIFHVVDNSKISIICHLSFLCVASFMTLFKKNYSSGNEISLKCFDNVKYNSP